MLRTALKPRWLGLFVVLVLVLVSFFWLGLWQLDVARDKGREEVVAAAAREPVVPIAEALGPHAPFPAGGAGRRVQATGRYAADGQFLVAPRRLDGRDGAWVVTPLVVESTGATLAVVADSSRSPPWSPPRPAARSPSRRRWHRGSPSEAPAEGSGRALHRSGLDRPRRARQRVAGRPLQRVRLRGRGAGRRWGRSPGERPGAGPAPVIGETGLSWRNAAYALQWWIFAAFAAYMWFRMVRDDHQLDLQRVMSEQVRPAPAPERSADRSPSTR